MLFERFTHRAIRAVVLAQEEASRLGQDRVGTEMLVVGVVAEGSELGSRMLQRMGVDLGLARTELRGLMGSGERRPAKPVDIPFTTASKQALEDTVECAISLGSTAADTSHLLLAILQQESGNGCMLLGKLCRTNSPKLLKAELLRLQMMEKGGGGSSSSGAGKSSKSVEDAELSTTLRYGKDLTLMARRAQLDPLVGREEQLARTIRILGRRSKNNPVLIGEAGVGKTSIAYGLAQRVAEGQVPESLRGRRVVQLDLAALLAGTRYRGDFEERLKEVIREVSASNRGVILVIDEVHTLVGAGGTGNSDGGMGIDAANLLKPALARGELQCIGATTLDEYRMHIEKDPALERRFQPVHVPEPTVKEAEMILQGLAPVYESHHRVRYAPAAVRAAVRLSAQYVSGRRLPDKAIDVLDEAAAKVRQQGQEVLLAAGGASELPSAAVGSTAVAVAGAGSGGKGGAAAEDAGQGDLPRSWLAAEAQSMATERRALAFDENRASEAEWLRAREVELREELWRIEVEAAAAAQHRAAAETVALNGGGGGGGEGRGRGGGGGDGGGVGQLVPGVDPGVLEVCEDDIAEVVASWTGIPVSRVGRTESGRLLNLEAELRRNIIGQDQAVQTVAKALRRSRAGLRDPGRPISGLLFCGPTGVGKTHLCKTLALSYFGSKDAMIRFDMSEFMEKHTVSKLIGAPPGYVGYAEGGALTEAVQRKPYSLLLFDEVEKAHPDVFHLMLQLLDDGRLTDARGRVVSFANCLVVMTSNVGSRQVQQGVLGGGGLGFSAEGGASEPGDDASQGRVHDLVLEELKSLFRPELLNRIDEVVVFRALAREDVRRIAEVEFPRVLSRLEAAQGLRVTLTEAFKEKVISEGFDPAYGARPLRRAVSRLLEDTLAEYLLERRAQGKDHDPRASSGSDIGDAKPREQEGNDEEEEDEKEQKGLVVDVGGDGKVVVRVEASKGTSRPAEAEADAEAED